MLLEPLLDQLEREGRKQVIPDRDQVKAYLERWYVAFPDSTQRERKDIPVNIFVHLFHQSDDPVFHSHPWEWFHSTILTVGYWEHTPWGTKWYEPYSQRYVDCKALRHLDDDPSRPMVPANLHWVELKRPGETWTLFTRGPTKDNGFWGFMPDINTGEIIFHETYLEQKSWRNNAPDATVGKATNRM